MSLSRSLSKLTKDTSGTVNSILSGSTKIEGVKEFVQNIFPAFNYKRCREEVIR